jgi:hypothetical protein
MASRTAALTKMTVNATIRIAEYDEEEEDSEVTSGEDSYDCPLC